MSSRKKNKTNKSESAVKVAESLNPVPMNLVPYSADLEPYSISELMLLEKKNLYFPQLKSEDYIDDLEKIETVIAYYTLLQNNVQAAIRKTNIAIDFAVTEENDSRIAELSEKLIVLNAWDSKMYKLLTLLDKSIFELTGVTNLVQKLEPPIEVFDIEKMDPNNSSVDIMPMHDNTIERTVEQSTNGGVTISSSPSEFCVIKISDQDNWAKASTRVNLFSADTFKFNPSRQDFDVAEFIYDFKRAMDAQTLNGYQRTLAFANQLSVIKNEACFNAISKYIMVDTATGRWRTWEFIEKYLMKHFTYDCVAKNAEVKLSKMGELFPAYYSNHNMDSYNETYLRYFIRCKLDADKSERLHCRNYLDQLPAEIRIHISPNLEIDADETDNTYFLKDYFIIANEAFVRYKFAYPECHLSRKDFKVAPKHGHDSSTLKGTRTITGLPPKRRICPWHKIRKNIEIDNHSYINCIHAKNDPLSEEEMVEFKKLMSNANHKVKAAAPTTPKKFDKSNSTVKRLEAVVTPIMQSLKRLCETMEKKSSNKSSISKNSVNKINSNYPVLIQPIFSESDDVYEATLIHPISNLDITINTLFDSGCTTNVISEQLVIAYAIPRTDHEITCKAIDGSQIICPGYTVPLTLSFGGKRITARFLILADEGNGNTPLLTVGRPSFNALGVDVSFPENVVKSKNLTYVKSIVTTPSLPERTPENILATINLLMHNLADHQLAISKLKAIKEIFLIGGRVTIDYYKSLRKLLKKNNSSIDMNPLLEQLSLLEDYSSKLIDQVKETTFNCSVKRLESIPEDASEFLGISQVESSLDITHVRDISDTPKDQELRNSLLPHLEELLDLNDKATISTKQNPCFININSARNIRIIHDANHIPTYVKQYPIPLSYLEHGDEFMTIMLESGKYEKVPYGTPLLYNIPILLSVTLMPDLITIKKVRFCHDLRALNVGLKCDTYPLPTSEDIFSACIGDLFTELDCESAFYQLCIAEEDRNKLSFQWRGERYRCVGVPFGLSFVSSTFQRVIEEIYPKEEFPYLLKFIDNLIIVTNGESHEEHAKKVAAVIERATKFSVRLGKKKCVFMKREMETLGMQVSNSTISMAPSKLESIKNWKYPTSWAELEHVVGFSLFVRKFVFRFSEIMKPLYSLLALGREKVNGRAKRFFSTKEAEAAFVELKKRLMQPIPLKLFNPAKQICIATDASKVGMCIVVYQPNGEEGPTADNIIDFYTRAFKGYECNYAPFKLEAFALHEGIMHFADLLYGKRFKVYTDQRALTHMFNSINTNRTLGNWLFDLLHFDFEIFHVPGIDNLAPDHGSRINSDTTDVESFAEFLIRISKAEPKGPLRTFIGENFKVATIANADVTPNDGDAYLRRLNAIDEEEVIKRLITITSEEEQLEIIERVHDQGHFGFNAVRNRIESLGHSWPKMIEQIHTIVGSCEPCKLWTYERKRAFHPIRSALTKWPFDHLQMDLITSLKPNDAYKYLLVVVDIFTSFTFLRSLPDKKSETIAAALIGIFVDFGTPKILQSDNEPTMVSSLMKHFEQSLGVEARTITPYCSNSNGKVENTIRTVSEVVRKLIANLGADAWSVVPIAQMFINNKIYDHLKISKFALMFNRENNICTMDSILNEPISNDVDEEDPIFMENWKKHLQNVKDDLLPIFRKATTVQQWKYIAQFNKIHPIDLDPIPVGTTVMLKDITRKEKDHPPYVGEYTILSVNNQHRYTIKNNHTGEIYNYPIDRANIKPMKYAIPTTEFGGRFAFVDYIIDDRVDDIGNTEYLVRWTGQNSDRDSWVPLNNITDPALITDYQSFKELSKKPIATTNKRNSTTENTIPTTKKRKLNKKKAEEKIPVPMQHTYRPRKRSGAIKNSHSSNIV